MFSDIQIFQTKIEGNIILEIYLDQLPKLEKFQFKGLKKSEIDKLREELNLSRGIYVSNQIKNKTENYIIKYFQEKGFLNATCFVNEERNQKLNSSTLIIDVNKNERVKIKEIIISSDENTFKQGKLKRQLKNTKETGIKNIFSSSKFIESDFDEDLQNLIAMYRENGYRDAKIIGYKTSFNNTGELVLMNNEGENIFLVILNGLGIQNMTLKN